MQPPRRPAVLAIALALTFAATAPGEAQIFGTPPPATPTPSTIVGRMGEEMTVAAARRAVAFSPFMPPRQLLGAALIPPFHGDDVRENRGIALEYLDVTGRRYALAQWPQHGASIKHFPALAYADDDCPGARSFPRGRSPDGIVWSTAHGGRIMTLQPDGESDARTLESEWKKLIRRGACR